MFCGCEWREMSALVGVRETLERNPVITLHGDGEQVTVPDAFTFQGVCGDCGLYTTPQLVPLEWLIEWKGRATQEVFND